MDTLQVSQVRLMFEYVGDISNVANQPRAFFALAELALLGFLLPENSSI